MQTRREHLLDGEKLFPIYRFQLEFTVEHPGRCWEGTTDYKSFDYMAPQPMTALELESQLWQAWFYYLISTRWSPITLADRGAKLVCWDVSLLRYDNWALRWFQHETRNTHLSNDELLVSFERFVNRKLAGHIALQSQRKIAGVDWYCLMGAEDGWRWKGPCRCEDCTKQGVVRIDH